MRFWPALGIKPAKSSCGCSVCCEPEQFELGSSMLIRLCIQRVRTWYLSADKSDVQHMEELFKQDFPVKTHSGLPILATVFFWSANIKAVCDRESCRGHHFREMEVIQLLTTLILWQKHLATDLAIRKTQPCAVLTAARRMSDPSWADCSGITGYREGRKWKEKVCFSYWLKIGKLEYSVIGSRWSLRGSPARVTEGAINLRGTPISLSATHNPEPGHSIRNRSSTCNFHVRDALRKLPNRLKTWAMHFPPCYF